MASVRWALTFLLLAMPSLTQGENLIEQLGDEKSGDLSKTQSKQVFVAGFKKGIKAGIEQGKNDEYKQEAGEIADAKKEVAAAQAAKASGSPESFDEWRLVDEALTDPTVARARAYLHERNVPDSLNMDVDAVLKAYVPASADQAKEQCNSRLQFEDMILRLPHNFESRIEGGTGAEPFKQSTEEEQKRKKQKQKKKKEEPAAKLAREQAQGRDSSQEDNKEVSHEATDRINANANNLGDDTMAHEAATPSASVLRAELSALKLGGLSRRAVAANVDLDALEMAQDKGDKAAIIELVLQSSGAHDIAGTQVHDRSSTEKEASNSGIVDLVPITETTRSTQTDVQTRPVPDSSTVVYYSGKRKVSDMGIMDRLSAFEWSCCAYKLFAQAQACCKEKIKLQQAKPSQQIRYLQRQMRQKKKKSRLLIAKIRSKMEQNAEGQCCKSGNTKCCSAPTYVFSPSALAKAKEMCSVHKQCRTRIPFLAGLHQGCEEVVVQGMKAHSEPVKGGRRRRNKVASVSIKADPAKADPAKVSKCVSKNLRTSARQGREWQTGLQFQSSSDPCGLMKISTIQAAINRWNVPKDGNTYRSPQDVFRPLADGFYKVREQQNNVSVVLSKKTLVTKHGSTFTKAFVCVKWWQVRHRENPEDAGETREERFRRRSRRRSKRRSGRLTCKLPAPQLKYDAAAYPKITGLAIPVNHAKCLANYLRNVVSKEVRGMCLAAHFTTAAQRSECGSTAFRQYHNLKTKDGKIVPSPLKCKKNKYLCKPTKGYKCAKRVCKTTTITKESETEGEAPAVTSKESCSILYAPNKCLKDIIPKRIRDAALTLCIKESYKRSTKCCTTSKAHLSSRLTAAQRREDESLFLQF